MADQSDVEVALVTLIDSILYPAGQTGIIPPTAVGAAARIYRGWPNQVELDADLRAGIFHVSVFPRQNMERISNRYPPTWVEGIIPATTYTLTASGQVLTVAGAPPTTFSPQNFAAFVNGMPYVVTTTAGETPAQIAAALGALIAARVSGTTVNGATITLPNLAVVGAMRVGATGSASQEVGRQEKHFQITFWCPTSTIRDASVKLVDPAIRAAERLTFPDGSIGTLYYRGSNQNDAAQKELLYRRDLFISVDYPTIYTITAAQMVAGEVDTTTSLGVVLPTVYS